MKKGVFIHGVTVEDIRKSSLTAVENLLTYGNMENVEFPVWHAVKYRRMTAEEVKEYEERIGAQLEEKDRICFDCLMPEDDEEILISTKWGVSLDKCEYDPDYGFGLEENGDWDGVVAWMRLPKPYKKEGDQNE